MHKHSKLDPTLLRSSGKAFLKWSDSMGRLANCCGQGDYTLDRRAVPQFPAIVLLLPEIVRTILQESL